MTIMYNFTQLESKKRYNFIKCEKLTFNNDGKGGKHI